MSMDFKSIISKIDAVLGPRTLTLKNKAEAEAYVANELKLAKAESEEEDTEKGKEKASKRLAHLRTNLASIAKTSWDGQSNSLTIPVYEFGYESDLTSKTDKSETEQKTPPAGNTGTAADTGFAGGGGATGFGDAKSTGNGGGGGGVPGIAGTAADGQSFAAGGGAQGFAKSVGELTSVLKSLGGEQQEGTKTKTEKAAKNQPEPYAFPRDMSDKEYLKEGVAKRGAEWGTDDAKSPV